MRDRISPAPDWYLLRLSLMLMLSVRAWQLGRGELSGWDGVSALPATGLVLVWAAGALACLGMPDRRRAVIWIICGAGTTAWVITRWIAAHGLLYELIENSLQAFLPWIVAAMAWTPAQAAASRYRRGLTWAVVMTFLGHGLYALGAGVPVPQHFLTMVMSVLHLSQAQARIFLAAAGCMDLLVCMLVWWPRTARYALGYAACWGILTAIARVWAYAEPGDITTWVRWLPETLVRLPHGLIPLALLRTRQI